MLKVIAEMKKLPDCHALSISFEPENAVADNLYTNLGFVKTGMIQDGELVAILRLTEN